MALRGTKVGDTVAVKPLRDKTLHGTIISIDDQNLRCVATAEGYHYAAPDDMHKTGEPDRTKAVEDLEPGDCVVLFNGTQRTVEFAVPVGNPRRYRVTFEEVDKALGIFREQTALPGDRYYVL